MKWFMLLLVISSFIIFSPHVLHPGPYVIPEKGTVVTEPLGTYLYPLHVDGWNHLSSVRSIVENHEFTDINPQLVGEYRFYSLQKGFHSFIGLFILLFGGNYSLVAAFFPALIFFFGSLMMYVVVAKEETAIYILLLLTSISSNSNVIGQWFFIPLSMTLLLFFTFIFFVTSRRRTFAVVLFLLSFFVHPLICFLQGVFFGAFLLHSNQRKITRYLKHRKVLVSGLFTGVVIIYVIARLLGLAFFPEGWTIVDSSVSIFTIFPAVFVIIGLSGLYFLRKQYLMLYFIAPLIAFFSIESVLYFITRDAFIIPYRRMLYFFAIVLSLSGGYVLSAISVRRFEVAKRVVFVLMLLVIGVSSMYTVNSMYGIQKIVTEDQVELLYSIPEPAVILADPFFSVAVYPLTGNKIVSAVDGNIGGLDATTYYDVRTITCEDQPEFVAGVDADYFLTDTPHPCMRFIRLKGDYLLYRS